MSAARGWSAARDEDARVELARRGHAPAAALQGSVHALTARLDLRIGAGAQYIYVGGDHDVGASTPFVALDAALGWRL